MGIIGEAHLTLLELWDKTTEVLGERKRLVLGVALVLVLVGGGSLLAHSLLVEEPEYSTAETITLEQLQVVRDAVAKDPLTALGTLPPEAVRTGQPEASGGGAGSIGIMSSEDTCLAFTLRLDADYILYGRVSGIQVGEVKLADATLCTPRATTG